jgi:hypothetical protein
MSIFNFMIYKALLEETLQKDHLSHWHISGARSPISPDVEIH